MSAPLRRWPSWALLAMDLIDNERAARGLPVVPTGLTYDETVDSIPRYVVTVIDSYSTQLEAAFMIDVEAIAPTYTEAESLAYDVDDIFMGYPLSTVSGGRVVLVDKVEVVSSPVEIDLGEDTSTRRFLATYQLVVRRG